MKKLFITIPTYNEKSNLPRIIERTRRVLEKEQVITKILIVDDNSSDGTGKIADKLAKQYTDQDLTIEVMHRKGKEGLATAYIQAFQQGLEENYDYFLSMDADLSHKPEYIHDFLEAVKKNDLVIGSRYVKGGGVENWSLIRRFISKGGSFYSRIVLGVDVKDFTGGYNMFTKKALKTLGLNNVESKGYAFWLEMKYKVIKLDLPYKEIPIVFPDRVLGKSKMSKSIFIEALLRVIKLRFSKA